MAEKYTQAEIDALGAKGQAFKNDDGTYSYPVVDEADLDNAIHAVGRGNADHDAIRKYIIGRADALGLKSKIPDNWNADGSLKDADAKAAATAAKCSRCDGTGTVPLAGNDVTCPQCGGTGTGENNAEAKSLITHIAEIRDAYRQVPETRTIPRSHSQFEIREVPNGTGGTNLRFTGFASSTGDEASYEMEDWLGGWTESVGLTAFDKTLSDGADVAFLLNHTGMTLARTKPGTLKLSAEKDPARSPVYGVTGLHSQADLDPQNMYVQAMRSAVDRGDLDEMSFAFRVMRQEWNNDYTRRWINEVSLDKGDVSLVNYGANPNTGGTVSMRQKAGAFGTRGASVDSGRLVAMVKRSRLFSASVELREGKVLSASNLTLLNQALEALHATDDSDIPGIVKQLQAIDAALDTGQAALAMILQVADPDGDKDDLEPALVPPPATDGTKSYADDGDFERRVKLARQKGLAA